jgi:bifunctional UDP-N-acetylglucosamine pyrophosphorylase/glucosamine-1-phosphate N-acetyltransferase
MNTNLNVVVLAAGMGSRMKSKLAKVLHRAAGMPLAEHVVRSASELTTPDRITVVIGHQAEAVRAKLAPLGVRFVEQSEQRGTGHALLCCAEALSKDGGLLLVLYGDTPLLTAATLRRLVDLQQAQNSAAAMITTRLDDPTGYGRVVLDETGNVLGIVEQKAASPEQLSIQVINSGIYCFDATLLWKYILEIEPNNTAHEYYLTDIVGILNQAGHTVRSLNIEDSSELLGINTRVELAAADAILRNRKARELMFGGVTMERPETISVDAHVRVGCDTSIEPCVRLLGNTVIGEDCRIGAGSVIENAVIGDRVHIAPLTMILSSTVHEDSRLGPFSQLRPGNEVGPAAHIGNFVELKNTRLGAGSKANHLAYLGDSQIGQRVNVGAGTITCNYDGKRKHPTHIGDGAFVGSNSTLVAPLDIGADGYIAAGSVITEDVPAGSLAFGRSRQVVKEGWVAKSGKKAE